MMNSISVSALEQECSALLSKLAALQEEVRQKLSDYADGKTLKGNELVGWLGEIYGKLLLDGTLVPDREEHDFICANGWRVSVKTRRGFGTGWQRTSAIPKFVGETAPTHLLFVHLRDDYLIDRIWLYPWPELVKNERFKPHTVRGSHRSFIFTLDERKDKAHLVYGADASPEIVPRLSPPMSPPSDLLPITLDPPRINDFIDLLLRTRTAEIQTYFGDGRVKSQTWHARRFTRDSNLMGNLRSRPEFRQGIWQRCGITKIHVRIVAR